MAPDLTCWAPTAAAAWMASTQLLTAPMPNTVAVKTCPRNFHRQLMSQSYATTIMQAHLWVESGALHQQAPCPHTLLQGMPVLAEQGEPRGAASQVVLSLGTVLVAPQQRRAGAPMQGPMQRSCMWCGMHAVQHSM